MRAERSRIEELARAVAEGTRVDWDAQLTAAADSGERRAIEQLRAVDELAHGAYAVLGSERTRTLVHEVAGTTFSPGQILGRRYRIHSLLGRGGMGEVWRAYDLKLRVDVALKTLRRESFRDQRMLERLRGEVRAAREVVSPNVCRIFDLVEVDGHELVSMEFIDGQTLFELLRAQGPLGLRQAAEIASQFLAGLEAIHAAGLVHRDVKPENIMITRAGRVVLMDFGLAKPHSAEGGSVVGTPAYMPPEQLAGEPLDARADIFAAGIVLAEMTATTGIRDRESRQSLQHGIREDPPRLPDSPWRPVLQRAVAGNPAERYPSARELTRALEEITLRVEGAQDLRPYPGLASFTEDDAEYFFGRELEVESMWTKLQQAHLLGLIGPSGAGKSSFLHAGLLPGKPPGWRILICTPGTQPLRALAQGLVAEFSGDTEATRTLLGFDDPDVAVSLFARWRQKHEEAVLIVDQFEELFTLNPAQVQTAFAELLGRLALEADVRVLLSMRDDFLFHCHEHPRLSPILSELTLLGPPVGAALRRALIQPALLCGYRFEDEKLAGEMLDEVVGERGALPLLAFAAARVWDRRDREGGLLTREAYEEIGGVGGALAQHAETTLEKIGAERLPIVRELFRNLVTAQGTRVARDRQELLSVFEAEERARADTVLDALIDARLLTSYEVPAEDEQGSPHKRIEIIHESLLSAWPRLVRWQTQDADGAQLRDQLRQAAEVWEQRGRSDDLLWSGTAFGEFQLWRERYPGGLSATEEAFGAAMREKAERGRRRRRRLVAAGFAALVAILAVVATLWRQSERAQQLAQEQSVRADAASLYTLAHLEIRDNEPTEALAYLTAAIERADSPELRRLALEQLWRGPTQFRLRPAGLVTALDFSRDGRWLVARTQVSDPALQAGWVLWPADGGPGRGLAEPAEGRESQLGPDSDIIGRTFGKQRKELELRSFPDGTPLRTLSFDGETYFSFSQDGQRLYTCTSTPAAGAFQFTVRAWPVAGGDSELVARVTSRSWAGIFCDVDPTGTFVGWVDGNNVHLARVEGAAERARPTATLTHDAPVIGAEFGPRGKLLATADDATKEIRLWSLADDPPTLLNTMKSTGSYTMRFDGSGKLITSTGIASLDGPPDALPIAFPGSWVPGAYHPDGRWIATANSAGSVSLWPLARPYPWVLSGGPDHSQIWGVAFTPDGSRILSAGNGSVRVWPLELASGERSEVLLETPQPYTFALNVVVEPQGRFAVASFLDGRVGVLPLDGGPVRWLAGFTDTVFALALGPRARLVAAGAGNYVPEEALIRVWDLETGQVRVLDNGDGAMVQQLEFTPQGDLLSSSRGVLRRWNVRDETYETLDGISLAVQQARAFDLGPAGRRLLTVLDDRLFVHDLETGRSYELATHGDRVRTAIFDPSGEVVISADSDGALRVGPISGGEPHLLLGAERSPRALATSPDGRWIVSTGGGGEIRLWPMPDVASVPIHTLPRAELLAKLRSLTNLRAVRDAESPSGWKLEIDGLPRWDEVPVW